MAEITHITTVRSFRVTLLNGQTFIVSSIYNEIIQDYAWDAVTEDGKELPQALASELIDIVRSYLKGQGEYIHFIN